MYCGGLLILVKDKSFTRLLTNHSGQNVHSLVQVYCQTRERERESVWGDMMEEGLLLKERLSERGGGGWREIWEEMKRLSYIAGPLVSVTLSFFLLSVVSLMMVGHLGELALSSTAIAISFAGVTGFSLLVCTSLSLYLFVSFFFFLV